MAHVEDRWFKRVDGKKVRTGRHGTGKRWLAVWGEPRRKKAFDFKDAAAEHILKQESGVPDGSTLFADYAELWMSAQTQLAASSRVRRRQQVDTVKAAFEGLTLAGVSRPVLQAAVTGWDRKYVPTSVRDLHVVAMAVLRSAVTDGLLASAPEKVNRPKVRRRVVWPLTLPEVMAIEKELPEYYRVLVPLGAATGMRISEMLGLTVDRISFSGAGAVITVDRQVDRGVLRELKGDAAPRSVPVDAETARMLREHLTKHPTPRFLVQSRRGGALPLDTAQKAWGVARKRLEWKVPGAWHRLRHFHASVLISAGMSPKDVAERLGHADPALTLRIYSHLWEGDENRAVAALEAMWGSRTLKLVQPPRSPQGDVAAGG